MFCIQQQVLKVHLYLFRVPLSTAGHWCWHSTDSVPPPQDAARSWIPTTALQWVYSTLSLYGPDKNWSGYVPRRGISGSCLPLTPSPYAIYIQTSLKGWLPVSSLYKTGPPWSGIPSALSLWKGWNRCCSPWPNSGTALMLCCHLCLADTLPHGGTGPGNDLPAVTVERNQPPILPSPCPNSDFLGFAYHLPTAGHGHSFSLPRVPCVS